ncbi:MAG TPA: Ppx/GppA phosphatase family protein [Caulobacterales bacterium]|nr:Ppx/GppA phosphatase family protein [Caulobacterales bacterium]
MSRPGIRAGEKGSFMTGGTDAPRRGAVRSRPASQAKPCFAALDLGTNNCRLLVAAEDGAGFRVVDGYSQIVRLGEGLAATGRLSDAAMARAYHALKACAERLAWRRPVAVGCIATQACRIAANGPRFLARVKQDLGLDFEIISAEEEARLSVLGCASLIDPAADLALIVDIGGGSTELAWLDAKAAYESVRAGGLDPPMRAWTSTPVGVVNLSEDDPEPPTDRAAWYESLVTRIATSFAPNAETAPLRPAFEAGGAHIIGTSGTVTSLAGVHLNLKRYQRSRVDGLWMSAVECRETIARLAAQTHGERAANPCIGRDRADLVVHGGAILEAVMRVWPVERVRVADRGLREGVLMRLMAQHRVRK